MRLVRNKPNEEPEFKMTPELEMEAALAEDEIICSKCNKAISGFPYYYNGEPERYHYECMGDRGMEWRDKEYKFEHTEIDIPGLPYVSHMCNIKEYL